MSKKVKIIIIAMAIIIVGLVSFIVVDKLVLNKDKETKKEQNNVAEANNVEENNTIISNNTTVNNNIITSENVINNTTSNNSNVNKNEVTQNKNNSQKDVDVANKAIREELKSRRFIAKNGLELNENYGPKLMKITNNGDPMYLVHISHMGDENGCRNVFFFVRYKDGQVVFDRDFEHKYEYDIFVDSNKKAIKAELDYKMTERTYYHTFDLNGITLNKLFWKSDYNVENTTYRIDTPDSNGNDVERICTENEFESEMNELESKYQFVKFDDVAVELTDENIDKIVK